MCEGTTEENVTLCNVLSQRYFQCTLHKPYFNNKNLLHIKFASVCSSDNYKNRNDINHLSCGLRCWFSVMMQSNYSSYCQTVRNNLHMQVHSLNIYHFNRSFIQRFVRIIISPFYNLTYKTHLCNEHFLRKMTISMSASYKTVVAFDREKNSFQESLVLTGNIEGSSNPLSTA